MRGCCCFLSGVAKGFRRGVTSSLSRRPQECGETFYHTVEKRGRCFLSFLVLQTGCGGGVTEDGGEGSHRKRCFVVGAKTVGRSGHCSGQCHAPFTILISYHMYVDYGDVFFFCWKVTRSAAMSRSTNTVIRDQATKSVGACICPPV